MIEKTDKGYILTDGRGTRVDIRQNSGKIKLLYIHSIQIDFVDSMHRIAGTNASRDEALVMLDELGILVAGKARVEEITENDVSVILRGDNRILVSSPWAAEETEIF